MKKTATEQWTTFGNLSRNRSGFTRETSVLWPYWEPDWAHPHSTTTFLRHADHEFGIYYFALSRRSLLVFNFEAPCCFPTSLEILLFGTRPKKQKEKGVFCRGVASLAWETNPTHPDHELVNFSSLSFSLSSSFFLLLLSLTHFYYHYYYYCYYFNLLLLVCVLCLGALWNLITAMNTPVSTRLASCGNK